MEMATKDARLAILLKSLGNEFADSVLGQIPDAQASELRQALSELDSDPPDDELVNEVLEEFSRFTDFALANADSISAAEEKNASADEEALDDFVSTGDPFADLDNLRDYQIAGALRCETPSIIAIILGMLPDERVGSILGQLPEEVQEDSFLQLQSSPQIAKPLLKRIVERVVETASALDPSAASDPADLANEKTASLLRAMDRNTRTSMLKALENKYPEMAEQVRDMLFLFEDILRFTDKTVRKLLTEVDTSELAVVLKNADETIRDRITSNLSKRAKATLLEEIEFLDSVSSDREEEAQKAICGIFAQLDQSGELEMLDES